MDLVDQTKKMATVVITLKLMPESPDVDLDKLSEVVLGKIKEFVGEGVETKVEKEAIGFGLSALKVLFTMDESKGDTEPLEAKIKDLEDVNSVEVIDVRRAIG